MCKGCNESTPINVPKLTLKLDSDGFLTYTLDGVTKKLDVSSLGSGSLSHLPVQISENGQTVFPDLINNGKKVAYITVNGLQLFNSYTISGDTLTWTGLYELEKTDDFVVAFYSGSSGSIGGGSSNVQEEIVITVPVDNIRLLVNAIPLNKKLTGLYVEGNRQILGVDYVVMNRNISWVSGDFNLITSLRLTITVE